MTFDEFKEFVEQLIKKRREAERQEAEALQRLMRYQNITGDQVLNEGGHYVAVRDGKFYGSYDTKGEAWKALFDEEE